MRFVPAHCVIEGMKLGSNLYNESGVMMLGKGAILSAEYVRIINRLRYNGIYIDDDISKDIEAVNVISDKLRINAVKAIKSIFIYGEKEKAITRNHVETAKNHVDSIVDEILSNTDLMINMVDMKVFDDYTYYHAVNATVISIVIGVALGLNKADLKNLGYAAMLHDIGNVFIDRKLLNKAEKLTDEEFENVKTHSSLGGDYIKRGYGVPLETYMGIIDHHEKYGGAGYPNDLQGNRISLFGRIIALADVYDALISDRPHRKALLPSEACEFIMASSMTSFDPIVVEAFVKKIAPYPAGTCVKLSNGMTGIVVENYETLIMRPKLKIYQVDDCDVDSYELRLADHEALNVTVVGAI
ncbi:HD-GYP domain-containing protein [Bacillota bacterium]